MKSLKSPPKLECSAFSLEQKALPQLVSFLLILFLSLNHSIIQATPSQWSQKEIGMETEYMGIGGHSDKFEFTYFEYENTFQFIGRTSIFPNVGLSHPHYKAGLMIRESIEADSKNLFIALSVGNGVILQSRNKRGVNTSIHLSEVFKNLRAPIWFKIYRIENTFRIFISKDGKKWFSLEDQHIDLPKKILIGIARTKHFEEELNIETNFDKLSIKNTFNRTHAESFTSLDKINETSNSLTLFNKKSNHVNASEISKNIIGTSHFSPTPQAITIYAGIALITIGLLVAMLALSSFILKPKINFNFYISQMIWKIVKQTQKSLNQLRYSKK